MCTRKANTTMLSMALVFLAVALVVAGSATALEVGDRAPDFTLPSTTGKAISLSQYQGKQNVLLEFFIAAASTKGT